MGEMLIHLQGLKKFFRGAAGSLEVIKGIDLRVNRGDFIAIEGRSGSGKSTLLSIVGLLEDLSLGSYQLCNEEVKGLSAYQKSILRNRHIGWIFQSFNLLGDMTVAENICLPLRYDKTIKSSTYQERISTVLQQVELEEKYDAYPGQLSGGQQQRVAIARALITQPDLLLADEPTGNLDSKSAEIIFSLLQKLHAQGATVMMVTHSEDLALRCPRRCMMTDGMLQEIQ